MAQHDGERFVLRGFQSLGEIGLDLVTDEPGRASALEPIARDMEHVAQKGDALALAKRFAERHAIGDEAVAPSAHGVEDEVRAAELEKRAMAVLALGRALQKLDRGRSSTRRAAAPCAPCSNR